MPIARILGIQTFTAVGLRGGRATYTFIFVYLAETWFFFDAFNFEWRLQLEIKVNEITFWSQRVGML